MSKNLKQILLLVISVVMLAVIFIFGLLMEKSVLPSDVENMSGMADSDMTFFDDTWFDLGSDVSEEAISVDLNNKNGEFLIDAQGQYILSGRLKGNIIIDASDSNIHLILDNATIKSEKGPAIKCISANKLVITLLEGSKNTIADSGEYDSDDEFDAAIYSETPITFNGLGSLNVDGLYKDAIHSKDIIKILNGDISTKSIRYGIYANDGFALKGGKVDISSKKDGIRTLNRGAEGKGSIYIVDGKMSIISGRSGLKTEKGNLFVSGGEIFINCVLATSDIAGDKYIEEGCINEQ